jgi:hypothetical protein
MREEEAEIRRERRRSRSRNGSIRY